MISERMQAIARGICTVMLLLLGLWIARGLFPALVWAFVLVIAINPIYRRAERRWPPTRHNFLLPFLFSLGISLLVIVPILLIAIQAAREAQDIATWLGFVRTHGIAVPIWIDRLPIGKDEVTAWWQFHLATPDAAAGYLERWDSQILLDQSRLIGSGVLHRVVIFAFTILSLFFLLRDGDTLVAQARVLGERMIGPSGERIARHMVQSVRGTIDGLVLVGLGEGFVLGIAYVISGVPHPVLFGLVTGIAAMIPFGAAVLLGIVALLLATQGAMTAAIILFVVGLVAVFIADHTIRPVLIGGATRVPFVLVLVGILGGVESFGLVGLFVGPAVMAALVMLWRDSVMRREMAP